MELFRAFDGKVLDDESLMQVFRELKLAGKAVIIHSRLFSLGKPNGVDAVLRIIELLKDEIGDQGSLCIPCYTFSAYNGEIFDPDSSKCTVGVMGELGRGLTEFIRTVHPIYSTLCCGVDKTVLNQQDHTTCFGKYSFFDYFSKLPNSFILTLGTNINAATIIHYYDQLYDAPWRFLKNFSGKISLCGKIQDVSFDAYVKKEEFYYGKVGCLARLDAVLTELKILKRIGIGSDWVQGINERDFHHAYKIALTTDPLYYLFSSQQDFEEYYEKNNFILYGHEAVIGSDKLLWAI